MTAIRCREAGLTDVGVLAEMRAATWGTEPYWWDRITGYLQRDTHPTEGLLPRVLLLAEVSGVAQGFIAGHLTRRFDCDGEIQWLDVALAHRRRGVAGTLLRELAAWFDTRGAHRICVDVDPANEPARAFYRKHGAQDLNPHWLVWPEISVAAGSPHFRSHRPSASAAFDLQPELAGSLVELRPLRAEDFPALYSAASDPLIWEQHPDADRYQAEKFREFFRLAMESGGAFLIRDRETGAVIGSSRYHAHDAVRREVEIGWTFLARSHWGGRCNREVKELMLRHAFRYVHRVLFRVGVGNRRSQRAVEKIGGMLVGLGPDAAGRENLLYYLTAADFQHVFGPLGERSP